MINIKQHTKDRLAIIDFETLATNSNAQILSIGVTAFNPTGNDTVDILSNNTFSYNVEQQENRDFDIGTIHWWIGQSPIAQELTFSATKRISVPNMLQHLNDWLTKQKVTYIVGNGASFDNAILSSLYTQYDIKPVVPYWADLDLRTMKWLSTTGKLKWPTNLTPHVASADSIYEAMQFQAIYKDLTNG